MHDTLSAATRPYAADSPLAHLLDMAQAVGQPTEDEQREDAVTAAAHHIYTAYPDTLGRVLDAMDWTGHPALHAPGFASSRVRRSGWTAGCGCITPCASTSTAPSTCSP